MPAKRNASGDLGEDGSFPRGGGGGAAAPSADDALQSYEKGGFLGVGEKTRSAKRAKSSVPDDDGGLFGGMEQGKEGKLPKFVELLKFKTMSSGMRLWGAVLEISHRELTICLPHGLRGTISKSEASDALSELLVASSMDDYDGPPPPALGEIFSVGQLLKCVLLDVNEKSSGLKKGLALTAKLSKVNEGLTISAIEPGAKLSACVSSVEDRGYVLSLGPKKLSGFLLAKDHAAAGHPPLAAGQLIECVAAAVDKKVRVVTVKTDALTMHNAATNKPDGVTLDLLQPGSLVMGKVKAVLEDGLVVSFLTYFTGTVDPFHLPQEEVAKGGLKTRYKEGQKLKLRVLYVDPAQKRVGLSLIHGLIRHSLPTTMPPIGYISDAAKVLRVDEGLGLLLRLPSPVEGAEGAFGYCHVSNLSDGRVEKLGKVFSPGMAVKCRVIAYRPMDHLATVALKKSVVEASLLGYNDCHPGLIVKGTVAAVEDFGALVDITPTIRALVPTAHLSEVGSGAASAKRSKGSARFKEGATVTGRVLDCKPGDRKLTITLKGTLVNSELPLVTAPHAAAPGMVTHGVVTGARDFGVFISFYGGAKGMAHASQCGLPPGQKPQEAFEAGQAVKCRVLGVNSTDGRIDLSLLTSKAAIKNAERSAKEKQSLGAGETTLSAGDLVTGTVREVRAAREEGKSAMLVLEVRGAAAGGGKGAGLACMDPTHLSDHPHAAEALMEAIKVGSVLKDLLVLEKMEGKRIPLRVTRKQALVAAGADGALPSELSDFEEGTVVPGYVASVIADGVFVRFGGRLTVRVPKTHIADTFVSDANGHFSPGQTVRAVVVEKAADRVKLSLKPSATAGPGGALLRVLYSDLLAAQELAAGGANKGEGGDWPSELRVGALVKGTVSGVKEYGVLVDVDGAEDVVGFATHFQAGGEGAVEAGDEVAALVLDVNKKESIVDLSFLSHLVAAKGKKKSSKPAKLEPGEEVEARVEILKDDYLVLSVPSKGHALGFAAASDYNVRSAADLAKRFVPGSVVTATVGEPSDVDGRSIVSVALAGGPRGLSEKGKKGISAKAVPVGSLVSCHVDGKDAHHLQVTATYEGKPCKGLVHVINTTDPPLAGKKAGKAKAKAAPLATLKGFREGQVLEAVVVGEVKGDKEDWHPRLDLSVRPSEVAACAKAGEAKAAAAVHPRPTKAALAEGDAVACLVSSVGDSYMMVWATSTVKGRVDSLDSGVGLEELSVPLGKRFEAGQAVQCYVLSKEGKSLSLTLVPPGASGKRAKAGAAAAAAASLAPGQLVFGKVSKIVPHQGLLVSLGAGKSGRVFLTDVADTWASTPLAGIKEGQLCQAYVLYDKLSKGETNGHVDLSLCASHGAGLEGVAAKKPKKGALTAARGVGEVDVGALVSGQEVAGFVKSINKGGCFVALSRSVDARIKMSQLADGFIEDPTKAFPPGTLVQGRIVSADKLTGRVEMTLKKEDAARGDATWRKLGDLEVGEVLTGVVKRVETYGVFVAVDESALTGMCHISEASDDYVKDLATLFSVGDKVRAKVSKIDLGAGRLSLAMRASALDGEAGMVVEGGEKGEPMDEDEEDEGEDEEDEGGGDEDEEDEEDEDEDEDEDAVVGIEDEDEDASEGEEDEEEDEEEEEEEEEEQERGASKRARVADPPTAADSDEDDDEGGGLAFGGGLDLGGEAAAAAAEEDEDAGEDKKLSKRDKKRAREQREREVRDAEEARLAGDHAPESTDEFERMIMSSPSSSFVWIKYMAFHVSTGEYDRARAVAQRAIDTINYREDQERLNVWTAWLGLENLYGSPSPGEAVLALFQKALPLTDQKKLHLALVGLLEGNADRKDVIAQVFKSMSRKFPGSCKVWLRWMGHLLAAEEPEAARKLLDKGLSSLPKRKHIKLITQAALLEFRSGSAERARGIMEGVLRNYPKRTDLWNVYIDQEVKLGDAARTRALLERATHLDLGPRKMKFLFKKYLEYEKNMEDDERMEHVKQRAMEYVQSHMGE